MKRFSISLRIWLLLVVVVAMTPGIALIIHHSLAESRRVMELRQQDAITYAEHAAAGVSRVIEGIHQTLLTLAQLDDVKNLDPQNVLPILRQTLTSSPILLNVGVTKANGDIIASAVPSTITINSSDRPWYQRLQQRRALSVGEFQVGKITTKYSLNIACPLALSEDRSTIPGLFAALNLTELQTRMASNPLPQNTELLLLDRNGTVLASVPANPDLLGKNSLVWPLQQQAQFFEAKDQKGVLRLFRATPVTTRDDNLWILIGVLKSATLAEDRISLTTNLLLLLGSLVAVLLLTGWGVERFILRPTLLLTQTAGHLAAGKLDQRTGAIQAPRELLQLADSFDRMAGAISEQVQQLLKNEAAIRKLNSELEERVNTRSAEILTANKCLSQEIVVRKQMDATLRRTDAAARAFINSIPESAYLITPEGKVLLANEVIAKRLSTRPIDLVGGNIYDYLGGETADVRKAHVQEAIATRKEVIFEDKRFGHIILNYVTPVLDSQGEVHSLAVLGVDITERKEMEERLRNTITELEKALSDVKTLSGLVPICSGCKKIRDDTGYWNGLEHYISSHTHAQFSHGMCPECIKVYFPGINIDAAMHPKKPLNR